MAIRDANIGWRRVNQFIPVTEFTGLTPQLMVTGGQAAGTALQITPDSALGVVGKTTVTSLYLGPKSSTDQNIRMASLGAANGNRLVGINGTNTTGLIMATAADYVSHLLWYPGIDIAKPIGFAVVWASDAAAVGARTITWRVTYTSGAAPLLAANGPGTVLDTVIASQAPSGTAGNIELGNRGVINGNSSNITTSHNLLQIYVEMNAFNAAFTENKYLVGLVMDYMPMYTIGGGSYGDRAYSSTPLKSLQG